jgi:two-component system sensor histidine kinase KdpD
MAESRANTFLQIIRRSQRGRLKIYLGYGPGVGKTYQMLTEGRRLKGEGIDVVVGLVETHGRADTEKMIGDLELVPRRKAEYHGITVEEMDVDAILSRKPEVVLIDELAHSNVPGSRNAKRYQDVQEILAAGIHVISTLNIQHLESLYNTVENLIGVKVRERIPDSIVADADQVVNIDLAAEDLQRRLEQGKIYPKERIATSLENFFTSSNLEHLRELTLRELASQLDFRRREVREDGGAAAGQQPDQIMVCLSSRGPNSAKLLRFASRLAGRLNRNWYAVYVQTPREEPTAIDATTQRLLSDTLTLANQLGATVFTFKGQDIPDTILRFAKEYRVGTIVIGRPRDIPAWRRLLGRKSVAEQLIHRIRGGSIVVYDAELDEAVHAVPTPAPLRTQKPETKDAPATPPARNGELSQRLGTERIVVWNEPVTKQRAIEQLVKRIAGNSSAPRVDVRTAVERIAQREAEGSTFLNEGVALPHARIEGLSEPQVALGVAHGGVLDSTTEKPIEVIFLLLSPATGAGTHLRLLAQVGRLFQNQELRRRLGRASDAAEVMEAVTEYSGATPIQGAHPAST